MRFRSDPSSLRGSIAPVVTPFTQDGELDTEGLRRLIGWQLDSGSHGISLGGSTGEPSAQTPQERMAAMAEAADVIADRVPFLPGTGSARLDETLELTAAAAALGADAALVITPYYARPTQEGLFQWYATVAAENPDLPIVVYNVPSRTAVDIAPETIARLRRRFGNVIGVKETTRDFEHFSRVLHQCGRDILVWSGIELLCLPLLALGGVGFVSAVANLAPVAVAQMFELWTAGEQEKARELHFALHPLVDVIFTETNPAPAKWVLQQAGLLGSAHVRPPLAGVSEAGQRRITELLRAGRPRADPATDGSGNTVISDLPGRLDHFIAGAWSPSADGATFAVADPVSNQAYAQVAAGGAADIDRAARAARCAFTDGPWPGLAARQRARVLNRIADGIERRGARIAELETFDTGLPITQARGQAERAAENFRFFADMIVTLHEDAFRTGTSQLGYVIRKPAARPG